MFSKLVALALTLSSANALCANSCSGHGVCREHDQCTCYANWQGNDCSERTCPYAKSWGDAPYGHNSAHYYSECSSQGTCDRKTGECQCFDGYEGDACRRMKCTNDCSGHGSCRSTAETAASTSVGEFFSDTGVQLNKNVIAGKVNYGLWDTKKTRSCVCDPGFGGIDCGNMLCPRGDDPLTTEDKNGLTETYDIQEIVVGFSSSVSNRALATVGDAAASGGSMGFGSTAQGHFTLTFTDSFGKEWTTRPIPASDRTDTEYASLDDDTYKQPTGYNAGETQITQNTYGKVGAGAQTTQHHIRDALLSLPNGVINDVEVSMDLTGSDNVITYRVTFTGSAVSGKRSLLKCNHIGCNRDGCQPRFVGIIPTADAMCTVKGATSYNFETEGIASAATDGQTGTGEDVECSNRGLCDYSNGQCACFEGYTGESCSIQTILV